MTCAFRAERMSFCMPTLQLPRKIACAITCAHNRAQPPRPPHIATPACRYLAIFTIVKKSVNILWRLPGEVYPCAFYTRPRNTHTPPQARTQSHLMTGPQYAHPCPNPLRECFLYK